MTKNKAVKNRGAKARSKKLRFSQQSGTLSECAELKIKGAALSIYGQEGVPFKVNANLVGEECKTLIQCQWDGSQWVCS